MLKVVKAKVVKVVKPMAVDELIQKARKCRKPVELCLKVGGMLQPIASYTSKQFLEHLRNFRRALEAPHWQYEELTVVLRIDNTLVEFQNNPRLTRVLPQYPSTR